MPCSADIPYESRHTQGRFRLALSVGLIALVWLIALPWLAARPTMQARIQWLDDRGIDPSAMYYTELEAAQPILERLQRRKR